MTCHISVVNITTDTDTDLYIHTLGNIWEVWYVSTFTYPQTQ